MFHMTKNGEGEVLHRKMGDGWGEKEKESGGRWVGRVRGMGRTH